MYKQHIIGPKVVIDLKTIHTIYAWKLYKFSISKMFSLEIYFYQLLFKLKIYKNILLSSGPHDSTT